MGCEALPIEYYDSMNGAGGLRSPIAGTFWRSSDANKTQFHCVDPCYDANGNITQYIDSNGTAVAHYEYSPFGVTTNKQGEKADEFAFRFSTKYSSLAGGASESDSERYYYGLRYYSPAQGKWLSRDPINELGSRVLRWKEVTQDEFETLYGFVKNNAIDNWDYLGMADWVKVPGGYWEVTQRDFQNVTECYYAWFDRYLRDNGGNTIWGWPDIDEKFEEDDSKGYKDEIRCGDCPDAPDGNGNGTDWD